MSCDKCGHKHTGAKFGYICIGCPCAEVPGAPPGTKPAFDPANVSGYGISGEHSGHDDDDGFEDPEWDD